MPPQIRYTKGDLLRAAFTITREQGLEALNARAIARALGCSTQPIFRAFTSMEEVRGEMRRMAMDAYGGYIARSGSLADKPYLGSGLAYIRFAREERELFKLLFMCDRQTGDGEAPVEDPTLDYVTGLVMQSTGLDRERAREFHTHLWIYTHGLASMVATRFLVPDEGETERLMRNQYRATRLLYGLLPLPEE